MVYLEVTIRCIEGIQLEHSHKRTNILVCLFPFQITLTANALNPFIKDISHASLFLTLHNLIDPSLCTFFVNISF